MDNNRTNVPHELFSRDSTPPAQMTQSQQYSAPNLADNTSSSQLDSLFHHLNPSAEQVHQQQSSNKPTSDYGNSASGTPSMPDEPTPVSTSAPGPVPASNNAAADRQSALLSLLGSSSNVNNRTAPGTTNPPPPQQVPTPPGSSQRSGASPPQSSEAQGKFLLEQLMAGNPLRSNYSDSQRGSIPPAAPSPPYGAAQRDSEYRPYNSSEASMEMSQRSQGSAATVLPSPASQQPQQPQQQQPPSPRKSMFEFISPFDHLSTSTSTIKKKPVPAQPPSVSSGNEDSSSWSAVSDPKRQSVDNLLEHLTRGQTQAPPPPVQPPPAYESYLSGSDFSQGEPPQTRAPLPPVPIQQKSVPARAASPRASPPKMNLQRPQVRESPAGQQGAPAAPQPPINIAVNRRDKDSSPGPRGNSRKGPPALSRFNAKNQSSPSPQTQTIIVDMSQSLDEIQAPRDSVKSTAIALVKQDSVFLPGTTIGATHWVAYAMTRGRVRVISRSSGDRTLLQLPPVFSPTASVTDMAVYGNRLAGVTSDGGFVVWELPSLITDDVPGLLLLCVPPSTDVDALHTVKWHPKEPDTLAVASDNTLYLIDLLNTQALHGQPLAQSDLHHVGQLFSVPSPLIAFDFDVLHYAIATISEDSTLTVWNIHDKLIYSSHKIRGEDVPSSLTFVDGGIIVGRKSGTIFQLLSMTTKHILSTIKFINGNQDDPDMFGHVSYDSRIQTLWVANCRRESMIAFKINLESSMVGGEEAIRGYFDQVVEFYGPKSTIHFVILTADADPNGDEAHAACIAAKVQPGELALVAFSVHSTGVDQILIRKEWFDSALMLATSKLPITQTLPPPHQISAPHQRPAPQAAPNPPQTHIAPPPRIRTPLSDDGEGEFNRDEGRLPEVKNRGPKGKNVNWKEREDNGKERDKNVKGSDAAVISDSSLGQALSREMKKTEESLHSRIARLISKEMDKQHLRFEEVRVSEQEADFARQEKILKLISTELTKNTTRVVELAVKSEVQNSVLPSLENITKHEVKTALNEQVGRGLEGYISQSLPVEIEKLLLRPDISAHFAHMLSSNLTPLIERHIKEAIAKTFIPVYSQQSSAMHQELLRDLRSEIHSIKGELNAWQNEAFRNQETSIRDLEHSVRNLSEQVKFLSMNPAGPMHQLQQPQQSHNSPGPSVPQIHGNMTQPHLRQPPPAQPPPNYGLNNHGTFPPPAQPPVHHASWFSSGIAAPQASHPATLPQPPPQQQPHQERTPPMKPEQWDEMYLSVLHTHDVSKLRELLSRTNPELIMPLNGPILVSQAVVLTLVHRLSGVVGETPPNDESFKTSLWWLQRAVSLLRPDDKLITDFIPRVIPNVQVSLNTTKQRLTILPGGAATLETARTISDIQETLRRKVLPV